jgi:hypothetical protein
LIKRGSLGVEFDKPAWVRKWWTGVEAQRVLEGATKEKKRGMTKYIGLDRTIHGYS